MRKTRSTKRALLAVVLAFTLCLSALLGTTFAWFTDSVSSNNNIIKSGNLDVELEYATVTDGQISGWQTVEKADKIFDPNALWEPGRVEVVYLKVSNLGTLALKYQLAVNIVGEDEGTNVNGEKFKLSDHLVFKVIDMPDALTTYTDREAAQLASGTAMGLKDHNGNTTPLEVGDVDYVAMIVYMPESVDNKANYRGNDIPTIKLGVNLYATQKSTETDSFGPDYDEGAWHDKFTVSTLSGLNDALANVEDGDVIVFGSDITVTDADTSEINALYYTGDKSFTIDLNGFTFTGNTSNAVIRIQKAAGAENTITIKNGSVVSGENSWSAISVGSNAEKTYVNLSNLTVSSCKANDMAIRARSGAEFTITDCEVTATNAAGGIAAGGGNVTLNNVTVNQSGVYSANYNSVALGISGGAKMTVNSGTYTADPAGSTAGTWVAYVMSSGGTLEINGGTFNSQTGTASLGLICPDRAAIVNINGGTFNSTGAILDMRNNVGTLPNPQAVISGGTFSADPRIAGYTYNNGLIRVAEGLSAMQNADGTWGVYRVKEYDPATENLYELCLALEEGAYLILPGGTYTLSGTLPLPANVTLKGKEGETVILRQTSAGQDNILACAGDAVIENITFESNRKGYAIADNTKNHDSYGNITVKNCKFTGIATEKNYGIYKNRYGNLTVENCTFDNYNVAIGGVNNDAGSTTVITGCTFTNINSEAIGYVVASVPADFEATVIANNTGLTEDNVIGYPL